MSAAMARLRLSLISTLSPAGSQGVPEEACLVVGCAEDGRCLFAAAREDSDELRARPTLWITDEVGVVTSAITLMTFGLTSVHRDSRSSFDVAPARYAPNLSLALKMARSIAFSSSCP